MKYSIRDQFIGAPTPTMKDRNEYLRKLENDAFIEMIYEDAPIERFDDFVREWMSSGGKEVTREVNEWYKMVSSKEP
jgi:putative aldouronate transport system substrate-binding protein